MKTIVAKFGGTSLADANQFRKVKKIIERDKGRRYIVVSAPGKRFSDDIKVTDLLIRCYENAVNHRPVGEVLTEVRDRFYEIIRDLGLHFPIDEEMEIIRRNLQKKPELDYMASRGEYLNAQIMAEYLGFTFVDPAWSVCFFSDGQLDPVTTQRAMAAALHPLDRAVIAGFYGADADGRIHTLSRGGSDISGSLVAKAVKADLYENWTDVSGLKAADPRIVAEPRTVDYLSYRELRALSYMGASVLHTDAVLPASELSIPINIRNTNAPEDSGTMIVRHFPSSMQKYPVVGVAGRPGMTVLQVEKVMVSDGAGFSAILLDLLKKRDLPFEQCLTGIDTVTLIIRSDLLTSCKEELLSEIRETLHPDYLGVFEHLSVIAVVGEKDPGSIANVKVLNSLARAGIEIDTINQGAGKLNLLIGVPEDRYEDAIRAIYGAIES
ncbi:MAG: aspartate kinase [Lachnospiraceae bacterium]|nr:aspartate kinase [Lachnospiraceae bacterium]